MTPGTASELLKGALVLAGEARKLLSAGTAQKDEDAIHEGAGHLGTALRYTVFVLREMEPPLSSIHRHGMNPWLPEDMIEELRLAIQIDSLAIEILLKDRPDLSMDEQAGLLEQATEVIRALQKRARTVKRVVEERWPGEWLSEHDSEFSRWLKKDKR